MCLLTRTEECARHPVHGELDTGERILRRSIRTRNCREESHLTYTLRALRRVVVAQGVGCGLLKLLIVSTCTEGAAVLH